MITDQIKVFEAFSGIGAQAKALERISARDNIDYELVATVDWDINAIIAYYLIHRNGYDSEKYNEIDINEIDAFLKRYTLSLDGKKALNEKSFLRLSESVKRILYAAIVETKNMVSITDVTGKDIPNGIDIFTYSFPCQDLSMCGYWHGNQSGIARDAHNRSGMLWEVERILKEMNENGKELPRFLVMENVCNILSKTHKEDFDDWKNTLYSLGYVNKIYRLNAKNFGIPQKRERAYMISVLCDNDSQKELDVEKFFLDNDLEGKITDKYRHRDLRLKDILCLDYSDTRYKKEADDSKPNDTPSRERIWNENDLLFDGKNINEIDVNTVTTKQDRNPNSGLIVYRNYARGKTKWRYLTPRECFKLMGFDEIDFDNIIEQKIFDKKGKAFYTKEKLIKLAGNSIVVDVLEAIFQQIIELRELLFM